MTSIEQHPAIRPADRPREECVPSWRQPQPKLTRRFRLYKISGPNDMWPNGHYTEVSDWVELPYENERTMPEGELLVTERHDDDDPQTLRRIMDDHLSRLGLTRADRSSWNARVSQRP